MVRSFCTIPSYSQFLLIEKVKINTDAASRFIRNALWNADVLQAQSSNDTSPNGGHISAAHNVDDSGRINKNK